MSTRRYAQRRGVHVNAVYEAERRGCVVRNSDRTIDADATDRLWAETTQPRITAAHSERAEAPAQPAPAARPGGPLDDFLPAENEEDRLTAVKPSDAAKLNAYRAQHEAEKLKITRLKRRKIEDQLIVVEDVEQLWAALLITLRQRFRALPALLAPRLAAASEPHVVRELLREAIDEQLVLLPEDMPSGEDLPDDSDEDDPPAEGS